MCRDVDIENVERCGEYLNLVVWKGLTSFLLHFLQNSRGNPSTRALALVSEYVYVCVSPCLCCCDCGFRERAARNVYVHWDMVICIVCPMTYYLRIACGQATRRECCISVTRRSSAGVALRACSVRVYARLLWCRRIFTYIHSCELQMLKNNLLIAGPRPIYN